MIVCDHRAMGNAHHLIILDRQWQLRPVASFDMQRVVLLGYWPHCHLAAMVILSTHTIIIIGVEPKAPYNTYRQNHAVEVAVW